MGASTAALQAGIPGGPETLGVLFWAALFPFPIYWIASRRGDDHPLAWALGAFLAGFVSIGIGAVVVGLLYLYVRD